MADNVFALTEAAAILNVCFESKEYKELSTDAALQLHGLIIRLTDLVEEIASQYHDDALLVTFEMMKVKMADDPEIKEYAWDKYRNCGDRLFIDMESYVSENEEEITRFFADNEKDVSTRWPQGAKDAYIDRCASSMTSQGLPSEYSQPYCACITDRMESEFGLEEYREMMRAQPNPKGSSYDRRLYQVFSSCNDILPK